MERFFKTGDNCPPLLAGLQMCWRNTDTKNGLLKEKTVSAVFFFSTGGFLNRFFQRNSRGEKAKSFPPKFGVKSAPGHFWGERFSTRFCFSRGSVFGQFSPDLSRRRRPKTGAEAPARFLQIVLFGFHQMVRQSAPNGGCVNGSVFGVAPQDCQIRAQGVTLGNQRHGLLCR